MINMYPKKDSLMLPKLWEYQEQNGWISTENMRVIADELDKSPIEVYEVASFYTMFKLAPIGKNHIEICKTISCKLCGSSCVKDSLEKKLGIKAGETSEDKQFTLSEVECLGACEKAPIVVLNGDYYYDMDDKKIETLLKDALK
ncbi:MAG: NAD(P)H-dependent oxidoreductase subunit E [Campylobacterota bacterium]|nr:NAD(P)H-dependent oxidoreductase subunit E [Campylobacterota bacterium]